MIARGRGGNTTITLILGQMGQEVDPPAYLEGTDGLVILVLHIDLRAQQLVQRWIMMERGARQIVGEDTPRL
jgi:hypothetical protein